MPFTSRAFRRSVLLLSATLLAASASPPASARSDEPMRYGSGQEREVSYRVVITVDTVVPDSGRQDREATVTLRGVLTYVFSSPAEDGIEVSFEGRLGRSIKQEPYDGNQPPGRTVAAANPFRGHHTGDILFHKGSNQVKVSPRGKILDVEKETQLPFVLGDASLLIFEELPEEATDRWEAYQEYTLIQRRRRFGPFRNPSPQSGGFERANYRVTQRDGALVTIDKSFKSEAPGPSQGQFAVTGSGTWVFNRDLGVPESMDFEQESSFRCSYGRFKAPITIHYHRLSEDEVRERHRRLAGLVAPDPPEFRLREIGRGQKEMLLRHLEADRPAEVMIALSQLSHGSELAPDDEIAAALRSLSNHDSPRVRNHVKKVLDRWSEVTKVTPIPAGPRTWTDVSGNFTVEAEFVRAEAGRGVLLRQPDGQYLQIGMNYLCGEDQELVRRHYGYTMPKKSPHPSGADD